MGKKRIIAETGAGQHGVATATVCALMGMECVVYMGKTDVERQRVNVERMQMLGGQSGSRDFGQHDPEGCHERSHTRLVLPPGGHVLCDWFHSGASSLPRHGSPLAVGHQQRNQEATDGARRT